MQTYLLTKIIRKRVEFSYELYLELITLSFYL